MHYLWGQRVVYVTYLKSIFYSIRNSVHGKFLLLEIFMFDKR